MRLLLLSNSTNHGNTYLGHADDAVRSFLDGRRVTFIPYAMADHDAYTAKVRPTLESLGSQVIGLHTTHDPAQAVAEAEAIFTGGGNTFRLLATLQKLGAVSALRSAIANETPYMGASAGTNIAGASIRTTNDMPIVQPTSFEAVGALPFQINPHYIDPVPGDTHNGETRAERLTQFLEANDAAVLGLREGTWLSVEDGEARIGGKPVQPTAPGPAIVFRRGATPAEVSDDVSSLLRLFPRFDC